MGMRPGRTFESLLMDLVMKGGIEDLEVDAAKRDLRRRLKLEVAAVAPPKMLLNDCVAFSGIFGSIRRISVAYF